MSKKPSIAGIILIVLGLVLLLRALHIYIFGFVWPLVFIVLGLWLIYRRGRRGDPHSNDPTRQYTSAEVKINIGPTASTQSSEQTYTHHVGRAPEAPRSLGEKVKFGKFIGDMYVDCNNVNMQNVEVSIFIGDLQVDLRGGKLNPGLNRMIVSGFLGDVIILAPKEMAVFTHCSGFIGDVDLLGKRTSGFGNNVESQTSTYDTAESKLYIAVNSFIGDIRVYPV
jgi:predicted membrane protein